jgi:ABC-type polysaccharide/polyol phosphate export permease
MQTETRPAPPATAPPARDDDFNPEVHVYEPHKVGLPPLRPYVRELWRRREFAIELSRTRLRAAHFNTAFGQLWMILNPLLLGAVYFVLVDIIRGGERPAGFFAHLMAGIFAYYLVSDAVRLGAKSVTGGGKLILNTAFPRALLPLSSVLTSFMRFLPTIPVYIVIHVVSGRPLDVETLWAIPILLELVVFAFGVSMLVAAAQVYFRDLNNFLPYLLRVWLYASPVLYYADEVPDKYRFLVDVNPLGSMLGAWSDALNLGVTPSAEWLLLGAAWAVVAFFGGALFFISREREFAVRL